MLITDALPDKLKEDYRIIPSEQTLKFSHYCENVGRKLLGDLYDSPENHIRFVVADMDKPEVFASHHMDSPVIGISTGMLRTLKTEDALAAVIASQVVHILADHEIGERLPLKTEQIASDVVPLFLLKEAGYNPQAMMDVLKDVRVSGQEASGILNTLLGNKFGMAMRIRLMENAEFAHRRLTGTHKTDTIPLPDDMASDAFIKGGHESYLARQMRAVGYEHLDISGKLDILRNLLETEDFAFSRQRGRDLADALAGLRIDTQDEGQVKAFDALIDTALSRDIRLAPEERKAIYKAGQMAWEGQNHPMTPLGSLRRLKTAMEGFRHAPSMRDAEDSGRIIHDIVERLDVHGIRSITDKIHLPTFSLPSKPEVHSWLKEGKSTGQDIILPWAKHVQWTVSASAEKASFIGAGLAAMGITDARTLPVIHRAFPKDKVPPSLTSPQVKEAGELHNLYRWQQLEVDADFKIIGLLQEPALAPDPPESLLLREQERLEIKERKAQKALEGVDWREMERDFYGFVEQYSYLLTPEPSIIFDDSKAFTQEFVEHLNALAQKQPDVFGPILQQFFTGGYDGVDTAPASQSLPALLKQYNHIHGIAENQQLVRGMPFGLSPNHPYVGYVLDDPQQLFSAADKINLIAETRYLDSERRFWQIHPDAILGFELPNNTYEELQSSLQYIQAQMGNIAENRIKASTLLADIAAFKIKDFLEKNPDKPLTNEQFNILNQQNTLFSVGYFSESSTQQLGHFSIRKLETMKAENADIDTILAYFAACSKSVIFLHSPSSQNAFEEYIKSHLDGIDDVAEKGRVARNLLHAGVALHDEELSKTAISAVVDDVYQQHGQDTNTAEYAARFKPVVDTLAEKLSPTVLYDTLSQLSERISSQEELSYYIRDKLVEKGVQQQYYGHIASGGIELFIHNINADEFLRQETIKFLRAPLTEDGAKRFAQKLSPELAKQFIAGKHQGITNDLIQKGAVFITHKMQVDFVRNFHTQIWKMPTAARIGLLEKILFPPTMENDEQFTQQKAAILDAFMPNAEPAPEQSEPKGRFKKFFTRNQANAEPEGLPIAQLADTLLEVNPVADQRLFLTGIMFAAKPGEDVKQSTDKAIAEGLMAMGPAGVKLAQAIDGMEKRKGIAGGNFAESKKMSQKPARWQVFEMLHDAVPEPEDPQHHTKRVGKVLGAGAYGVTIMRERMDGVKTAVTVLPKYVRERAGYEFGNFEAAVRKMAAENPDYIPLIGLVEEARHMANIETDMDIAAKQAKLASEAYDNLGFEINGQSVRMSAAPWIRHGKDYKETEMVSGLHFNDMPARTPEERERKQIAGQAAWAAEQYIRLRGMPTDHDRHGAQQLVEMRDGVLHIQNFDFGAMDIEPPTEAEKKGLIDVLFGAAKDSILKRKPLMDTVGDRVKNFKGDEDAVRYIRTFGRAAVAMSDFESEMLVDAKTGQTEEVSYVDREAKLRILGTIFETGRVDPTIEKHLGKHLGPAKWFAMGRLKKMGDDDFNIVHYQPSQTQAPQQVSYKNVVEHPNVERERPSVLEVVTRGLRDGKIQSALDRIPKQGRMAARAFAGEVTDTTHTLGNDSRGR